MKILKATLLSLLLIISYSCSEDDDSNNNNEADFQLTIDGNDASNRTITAILINETLTIQIVNQDQSEVIGISVLPPGIGNFDLGPNGSNNNFASYLIDGKAPLTTKFEDGSGEITITNFDTSNKTVSGNFNFTAYQNNDDQNSEGLVITVTGSFEDLEYVEDINVPSTSNLSAKIDGEDHNPDSVIAIESTVSGYTTITINALNNSTFRGIGITMPADIVAGTYDFSSLPLQGNIIGSLSIDFGSSNPINLVSLSGDITISSHDTSARTMEGTFQFTAGDFLGQNPDTFEVTEGSFSISY